MINVALNGRQEHHRSIVVEIEGKLKHKQISILINPRASLSYITPSLVENCMLEKLKHPKYWLVQLATETKRKVKEYICKCNIRIDDQITMVNFNVLPLGSYDILIEMDWLESHKVVLNCYEKSFVYQDEDGIKRTIQGLRKTTLVRQI
jgi:hypothetical protein